MMLLFLMHGLMFTSNEWHSVHFSLGFFHVIIFECQCSSVQCTQYCWID